MHSGELARQRTHTLDESVLIDSEESDRPIVDFFRATPGRMVLMAVALVAALLAVGATASKTAFDRQGQLDTPAIAHRTAGRCRTTHLRGSLVCQHNRGHRVPVRRRRTARRP